MPSTTCSVVPVDATGPSGRYLTPGFEHARVADARRPRGLTCEHVHASVVLTEAWESDREVESGPWAVITDHDILRSAADFADRTAGDVATGEVLLANPDERLPDVAQRMLEHGTSHAVVVEPHTGRAIGVLSTLDIAGILGWGLG